MATTYLYVMGAASGAGKSTVCMGVLAHLLSVGFKPEHLAYIKPITQCVAKQTVALFCEQTGIPYLDVGPLVFTQGFSRDFIEGKTKNSEALMADVLDSIHRIGLDKRLVVIDGVGGPAVGSIVSVSNVDVALSLTHCKVIFVGIPGIGSAIDNTVLCVTFLQSKGLSNIGIIYNNISADTLGDTKKYLTKRIPMLLPETTLFGFLGRTSIINNISRDNMLNIAYWFDLYINPNKFFYEWVGLQE
jgi:dethiobiotin synthetase